MMPNDDYDDTNHSKDKQRSRPQSLEHVIFPKFDDYVVAVMEGMSRSKYVIDATDPLKSIKDFLKTTKDKDIISKLSDINNFIQNLARTSALSLFGQVEAIPNLEIQVTPDKGNDEIELNAVSNLQFQAHPLLNNDGMPADLPAWLVASEFELSQVTSLEDLKERLEEKNRKKYRLMNENKLREEPEYRPAYRYTIKPTPGR